VRSHASILVIPRRKTSLCEALHGRRPWPDLKLHGSSWLAHRRGEGEGEGGGEQGGAAWGGGTAGAAWFGPCVLSVAAVREVLCSCMRESSRRMEKGEEKKKRKEKKKKWKISQT
jgi:hypothetical protein